MNEYEVEIVTELDEVDILRVKANSPAEAVQVAIMMVENGYTYLDGRHVVSASAL